MEGGTSLVVDDTPCIEVRLAGSVASLPRFDSAFDRLDSTANPFLDEVCREVGFLPEAVLEASSALALLVTQYSLAEVRHAHSLV